MEKEKGDTLQRRSKKRDGEGERKREGKEADTTGG